jgi:hypothetical protein
MSARFRPLYGFFPVRRFCSPTSKSYLMTPTDVSSTSPATSPRGASIRLASSNGDLNNVSAARPVAEAPVDPAFLHRSLAIQESDDDPEIRRQYRPFLLPNEIANTDWIASLEMSTVMSMVYKEMHQVNGSRLKVLVLYGSLRERCVTFSNSFSLFPGLTFH